MQCVFSRKIECILRLCWDEGAHFSSPFFRKQGCWTLRELELIHQCQCSLDDYVHLTSPVIYAILITEVYNLFSDNESLCFRSYLDPIQHVGVASVFMHQIKSNFFNNFLLNIESKPMISNWIYYINKKKVPYAYVLYILTLWGVWPSMCSGIGWIHIEFLSIFAVTGIEYDDQF